VVGDHAHLDPGRYRRPPEAPVEQLARSLDTDPGRLRLVADDLDQEVDELGPLFLCSRMRATIAFGLPPGLPETPGWNGRPTARAGAVSTLFSASSMLSESSHASTTTLKSRACGLSVISVLVCLGHPVGDRSWRGRAAWC
jgi:hypothetical protein